MKYGIWYEGPKYSYWCKNTDSVIKEFWSLNDAFVERNEWPENLLVGVRYSVKEIKE